MALHPNCHMIGVTGGKGGVGKSLSAVNLAFALQQELKAKVLLIDLDKNSCGDLTVLTSLRPVKTVSEFCQFSGLLNEQTLPTIFAKHATGLYYLGAVKTPTEVLSGDPDLFGQQIEKVSSLFNFIVVDMGSEMQDLQMAAIDRSSALLFFTTPEILAVNQTSRLINEVMSRAVPGDMILPVVSRATNAGLSPQAITTSLRRNILMGIPQDDATAMGSMQSGTPFVISNPRAPLSMAYSELVKRLMTGGLLQKLKSIGSAQPKNRAGTDTTTPADTKSDSKKMDPMILLRLRVHQALISSMDLKKKITDTNGDAAKEKALRVATQQSISQIIEREAAHLSRDQRAQLIKEVLDEALGLGPLEDLLADDAVTEIMVNGPHKIFIEKSGRITQTPIGFTSNQQLRTVIERIVQPLGRQINNKVPYVDARLKDGSRVNAVIEPIALDGAALTIRKFAKKPVTPDMYIGWGTMTQSMLDLLKICVENGLNIVISGGTGSGKTTLLNVLSSFVPSHERVITIEDAAELQLKQEHVVRLETRPSSAEEAGAITIRDLVRNALRMRPDRIIVGECRGGEALDMLQAMNTGHDGSMTTTHANTPREALARLETLCLMAGMELPAKSIKSQISKAVHLIVQISRLPDGSRKVMSITEVQGMMGEEVTLQEVFTYRETGFDPKTGKILGQHTFVGMPKFIETLDRKGVKIPKSIFQASTDSYKNDAKKASGGN